MKKWANYVHMHNFLILRWHLLSNLLKHIIFWIPYFCLFFKFLHSFWYHFYSMENSIYLLQKKCFNNFIEMGENGKTFSAIICVSISSFPYQRWKKSLALRNFEIFMFPWHIVTILAYMILGFMYHVHFFGTQYAWKCKLTYL